jgi:hypothetical protein
MVNSGILRLMGNPGAGRPFGIASDGGHEDFGSYVLLLFRPGVRESVEVLDEDGFVADFVVDEFVDGAGGEEKAVSSGAHAFFFAVGKVGGGVGRGV